MSIKEKLQNMSEERLSFSKFTRVVIDAIEETSVEYMIGGAVALSAWGEPRTTQDFDVVIHLPIERIALLSQELKKRDMLVPPEVILDLLLQQEGDLAINAIHLYSGYKAELFLLRPSDIYRTIALARRRQVDFNPTLGAVYVHSPEDLIIYKLRYYGLSEQTKHMRDIQSILLAMGDELDLNYIETWIHHFGLSTLWEKSQLWSESSI